MTIDPQKKKNHEQTRIPASDRLFVFAFVCSSSDHSRIEEFHLDKTHGTLLVHSASRVACISLEPIFLG